jgi:hypothetical protein
MVMVWKQMMHPISKGDCRHNISDRCLVHILTGYWLIRAMFVVLLIPTGKCYTSTSNLSLPCPSKQFTNHTTHTIKNTWTINKNKQTPWPESMSELYRPSDRRLSAKFVPAFADRGCHVVSAMDLLGFLDRSYWYRCYINHRYKWTDFKQMMEITVAS